MTLILPPLRVFVCGVSLAAGMAVAHAQNAVQVQPDAPILSRQINAAVTRFAERGGEYVLGPNDCSIFVIDFLKACGKPVKRRYTTGDFWKPSVMNGLKLKPTKLGVTEHAVFVTRYVNAKGRWVGHCGIVLTRDGQTVFIHNSEASGGVVVEPSLSFEGRMLSVDVTLRDMRFFTP